MVAGLACRIPAAYVNIADNEYPRLAMPKSAPVPIVPCSAFGASVGKPHTGSPSKFNSVQNSFAKGDPLFDCSMGKHRV